MPGMIKLFLVAVLALLVVGCARTELVGHGVNHVCNLEPEDRLATRYAVDRASDPHKVRIECVDEMEEEETPLEESEKSSE